MRYWKTFSPAARIGKPHAKPMSAQPMINPRIVPPFNGGSPACGRPDMTKWSRTTRPVHGANHSSDSWQVEKPEIFYPAGKDVCRNNKHRGYDQVAHTDDKCRTLLPFAYLSDPLFDK